VLIEYVSVNGYAHQLGVDAIAGTLDIARNSAVIEHSFKGMAMLVRRKALAF